MKISSRLYTILLSQRAKVRRNSRLLLLGADANGICIVAIPLKQNHREVEGCEYMPGIPGEELSKGYFQLAKKNLTFGGFAHLSIRDQRRRGWDYLFGDMITRFGYNVKFVTFGPTAIRVRFMRPANKIGSEQLKVVKTPVITKSKTLKEEQRNVRNTSNRNRAVRKAHKAPAKVRSTRRNNSR